MTFHLTKHQMVIIDWEDPSTEAGWHDPSKIATGEIRQLGYVAETRDDHLVLCSAYQDGVLCGDPTIIPWGVVKGAWILVETP